MKRMFVVMIDDMPNPWGEDDISSVVWDFALDNFGDVEVTVQEVT